MKLSTLLIFPITLAVTGCMEGAPIEQPPVSTTLKNEAISSRVVGYTEPVIRTFIHEEISEEQKQQNLANPNYNSGGPERIEISGATCAIDSAEFSAQFQTPAIVRLPKFHGRPTPVRMTCKTPELSATHTQAATLDGVVVGGASVAGLVAAAVTAGIAAGRDNWSFGGNNVPLWVNMKD